MAYKMKGFSGFKNSPAKDMKTGKYEHSFESPAKQKQQSSGKDKVSEQQTSELGKKVKTWEKGSKGATEFLNKRADMLKTLKKVKARKSPAKQRDSVVIDGKTYPKGYTKKDVKFLKEQREDVVRYEDLDAKGKAIWDKRMQDVVKKKGMHKPKKKKSPAKQEGPLPKENPDLKKSEMKGTYVYKGKNLSERGIDLDERASFIEEDISNTGKATKQQKKDIKFLDRERDIIMKRRKNTTKKYQRNVKPQYDDKGKRIKPPMAPKKKK